MEGEAITAPPPSFFDILEEYYGACVGDLHIAPSEFWLMTPAEAEIAVRFNNTSKLNLLDNASFAVYNAIGKALGGKKWEPVFSKAEQKQRQTETKISSEDKQKELNYLKELFNKR